MDMSWSYKEKADAPTLVLKLKSELMEQIRHMTTGVGRLESVYLGINEGTKIMRGILCRQCSNNVRSKNTELLSKRERQHSKKKLKMLSPEFQQLVDELTTRLFQLERYQNEKNDDEEYCTPQQYYAQEKLELEQAYEKELQDMDTEINELRSKHTKEIKERDKRINDLENQLKSEMSEKNKERKRLEAKLVKAEGNVEEYKKDLERKQEGRRNRPWNSGYVLFQDTKDDETKQLKEDLCSKDRELQTKQEENERMQTRIRKLSQELEYLKESMKNQRGDNDSLNKSLGSKYKDLQESQEKNNNLRSRLRELSEELGNLKKSHENISEESDSLNKSLSKKDEEMKTMEIKLKQLEKAMKKEKVLGLCKERSGMGKAMVDMITRELKRRVGGMLERDNTELAIRQCTGTSDIPNGPLVVLCLNMSMIGTNIQDALGGIQTDKNVYVLVLHHTNKANLSSLTPTSLRVTGSELRQLGGIIDMAFSSDSGLYECDLNDNAIDKITSIMRKY